MASRLSAIHYKGFFLIYRLLGVALMLMVPAIALPDAHPLPMWQVEGEHNRIYILGSVHLLRAQDHPLPDAIYAAYEDADSLVMELDMDDLDPVAIQALINDLGMIKSDESLSDLMGAKLYAEAEQIAEQIDIPLGMLARTEPWLAAINVEQLILMRIGFNPAFGVESRFTDKAGIDNKQILGLESIDQQLGFLDNMSLNAQRTMLIQTLSESVRMEEIMDKLITAWRHGDVDFLENNMLADIQEFPELYEALVVTRNRNWTEKIETMLQDDQDYLIIVGALHLIGEDGLPTMIGERGYPLFQMQQQ